LSLLSFGRFETFNSNPKIQATNSTHEEKKGKSEWSRMLMSSFSAKKFRERTGRDYGPEMRS
jgi:hypothetical protein